MREAFKDLLEFEKHCGYEVHTSGPVLPSLETERLRIRLIKEEFNELMEAIEDRNIAEVADAGIDLIYVTIGTLVRYGIDAKAVWDSVHAANMAKFGPGSWRDETGKVRKPTTWVHPDVESILSHQGAIFTTYGDNNE